MMKKISCLWLTGLFVFCLGKSNAQMNDSAFSKAVIHSVALYNTATQKSEALWLPDDKSVLLIFLSPDCPLCKNYSSVLNDLEQQFASSVSFYGIIPGDTYTMQEIDSFRAVYHIQFPVWTDRKKQLSNYVKATVTPEVILLDNRQHLIYKGAIDNWAVNFGKQRQKASQHYLQDAITQSLQHEAVVTKRTQPVGCRINDF